MKNFQSLKDVTFSLGKVTVLRGKSDVGKSAVIRALNAFFSNSFNQEYAHNGDLPFGVAIQKDNKVAIGRRTTKGVAYKFDSAVYSKTAKKIPSDISSFLGIYPYAIDVDMSVFFQIQKQFDTPFLLADSSITVAKIIGRVSNLNIVLMAMREMYASQLEAKQEINYLFSRKKELQNSLWKFSNFDSYEENFKKAEAIEDSIADLETSKQKLYELVFMGESYNKRVVKFKKDKELVEKINDIIAFLLKYETVQQAFISYSNAERSLANIQENEIDSIYIELSNLTENVVRKAIIESIVYPLSQVLEKEYANKAEVSLLDSFNFEKLDALSEVIENSTKFNARVRSFKELKSELVSIEKDYNNSYNDFTSGKTICPFSKLEMQDFCKKNLLQ